MPIIISRGCSCISKAAFFRHGSTPNSSHDYCYLMSSVLSMELKSKTSDFFYKSTAYLKVQSKPKRPKYLIIVITVSAKLGKATQEEEMDEDLDLKLASANDFSMRLGGGGFGSVYEGRFKRLDGAGQGFRDFRAQVETREYIHHVNLVRLEEVCAEKSHRILVYEYLPNGSMDKWIFPKENRLLVLKTRSKGSYFGLAKLINREQSEVITMLRGTPGYMAPELLGMHFTEKVDIYSFGVMVVEIVSGKRSRELSTPSYGLFSVLPGMAEEGRLKDLVDSEIKDEGIGAEQEATKVLTMAYVVYSMILQRGRQCRPWLADLAVAFL
ncbi:G-type lectin S-receptor-like serine/threonine-protein kinase SD2-5 [Cryptomeria japonica]|uniref:G-type lectin S-receptor-like serine/threonine-protein kinase SD2-5 n=1 Tax=Cryptomeria japonica TaxID=3369 RepID=UPI0027DAB50C|nr:G-type lectin S-receptor-like serine/threonine-protein kinase SD2-5 [Cryptomeria japonica]